MKLLVLSTGAHLYSTQRLVEAGHARGHTIEVIDHTKCEVLMQQSKPIIIYENQVLPSYDAVIPRIGASVTFYGAAVVRQFEMMKILTINESQAIVRSRDKLRSLQILSRAGVGIPKTAFSKHPKDKDVDQLIELVDGPPVIIKLLEGTQGMGVMLADSAQAAKSTIEAFSNLKAHILVQEFIKEAQGVDVRAFVVGSKVVAAMKRQGKKGEFRSNLHRGGMAVSVQLTEQETEQAVLAAQAMGLAIAGVDLLQSQRGPLILEVNSSPGLEGIEKTTQVNVAESIIAHIEACFENTGLKN